MSDVVVTSQMSQGLGFGMLGDGFGERKGGGGREERGKRTRIGRGAGFETKTASNEARTIDLEASMGCGGWGKLLGAEVDYSTRC